MWCPRAPKISNSSFFKSVCFLSHSPEWDIKWNYVSFQNQEKKKPSDFETSYISHFWCYIFCIATEDQYVKDALSLSWRTLSYYYWWETFSCCSSNLFVHILLLNHTHTKWWLEFAKVCFPDKIFSMLPPTKGARACNCRSLSFKWTITWYRKKQAKTGRKLCKKDSSLILSKPKL